MHTLSVPLAPDDVVKTNLILQFHFNATEILPLWRDQLPTGRNKLTK